MPRPAFSVVTSSVAALVVVGFAAHLIRPLIPKTAENQLAKENSEFLNRAAIQKIDWKQPTSDTFAGARRRALPILLFIGSTYSPLSRGLDAGVFLSPRVQSFLGRNFECIRVDLIAYPEYRNAFLPLERGNLGFPTGCQLWVLDPSGRIIDLLPNVISLFPMDDALFLNALVTVKNKYEAKVQENATPKLEEQQIIDAQELRQPTKLGTPPFSDFATFLTSIIYEKGGFRKDGPRVLTPEPWRHLLLTGRVDEFRRSFDPVVQSPACDLVDGGFFHGSRDANWLEIDYDKSAMANANMLVILASAAVVTQEPLYRYLAIRTFDGILADFALLNGFAAGRVSDPAENGRSSRASFGVRKLNEALATTEDRVFARDDLGLRVESNPRMTPFPTRFSILDQGESLDRVLQLLREKTGPVPAKTSPGFTDVGGYTVARLLEAARILGDADRLSQAESHFQWVQNLRIEDDVPHGPTDAFAQGYLGDYLAFADASFQYYLVTGRRAVLLDGQRVLSRALSLFQGERLGILNLGVNPIVPLPTSLSLPELSDPGTESATAYAIRLCTDYGRVLKEEKTFREFAGASTNLFGPSATQLGLNAAGFFSAARQVFDDEFFISVGPKAQEWADKMAQLSPFRLSIAAFGDIRPDVRALGPGVYLVRGETIRGPFTPDQASKEVSPFLGLDL